MKKNKILVDPFDDIIIVGIVTSLVDYQLAWHLNKMLKTNFVKCKDITSNSKDYFSFYLYDAGENSNVFNLVALSNKNKRWVSFSPQTDYLFIIRNYINEEKFQQYLTKIKSISKVQHAYVIDLEYNTKIDTILAEVESHETDIINSSRF